MTIYSIAYDLINERSGYDYQPLWDEFARLGAQKVQYSMYLVNLNNTAREVLDHFKQFVDSDDRLWVIAVKANQYTFSNSMKGTNDWLVNNPPS